MLRRPTAASPAIAPPARRAPRRSAPGAPLELDARANADRPRPSGKEIGPLARPAGYEPGLFVSLVKDVGGEGFQVELLPIIAGEEIDHGRCAHEPINVIEVHAAH